MKRFHPRYILRFLLFAAVFVGLIGFLVMSLWNATLPLLVQGVSRVTFAQSVELLILARLLFGGFRGPWNRPGFGGFDRQQWKQRMGERWQQLTPEQREKLRSRWGNRCRPGWDRTDDSRGTSPADTPSDSE